MLDKYRNAPPELALLASIATLLIKGALSYSRLSLSLDRRLEAHLLTSSRDEQNMLFPVRGELGEPRNLN